MIGSVNYILHHRNVYFKMSEDSRLSPYHLSIYNALFMIWNECGYAKDLSINRNDVMMLSKIGNANTYTKCLKDLNNFGYIIYKPSFNPLIGSKVTIIRYDKGSDKCSVLGGSKGNDIGIGLGGDTLYKQLNLETNKQRNKETIDSIFSFSEFWNLYPKKVGKAKCQEKYYKLTLDEIKKIKETIYLYVVWKQFDKWEHPNPETYINQKRWDDELLKTAQKSDDKIQSDPNKIGYGKTWIEMSFDEKKKNKSIATSEQLIKFNNEEDNDFI